MKSWVSKIEDISIEIHRWHGEAAKVFPPIMAQYLADKIPNCRANFILEVGHFSLLPNHAGKNTEIALTTLESAVTLAEPNNFIRPFVDEGPPMAHLLYEALNYGIAPVYVQQLLAAFPDTEPEEAASTKPQMDQSGLIEPLSEREMEVLQFLAKGLTNQVIATKLYLSVHTIKSHTRNIYSKLDVNNRTQAVNRARTLGILPSR